MCYFSALHDFNVSAMSDEIVNFIFFCGNNAFY